MIGYAADTSKWEDWQRDYRLGLILIMPPPEVSRQIDPLRAKYDPRAYAICPTHISVSDPLRREMTPQVEHEIGTILNSIKPFTLHFDRPQASTKLAGVVYPIEPKEQIATLQNALHATSAFAGKAYYRRNIPPHMTIAEFISIEDGLMLCAQLCNSAPRGSFLCDRLEFIVPDAEFHFRRQLTFPLGATSGSESLP
jgi:2'-5' RNA ligase